MKNNRLLENLSRTVGSNIPMRRYSLADMVSESYKMIYNFKDGSNLKKLAETHLNDVKDNPRDIERLSRQVCILKELSKMVEANELKDTDLVDKEFYDTVEPKENRVIVHPKYCNESAGADWDAFIDSPEYDEAFEDWYKEMRIPGVGKAEHHAEFQATTPCEDAYKRWQSDNKVNESTAPRRSRRRRPLKESCASKKSIKEADDQDLTDEELEELAKHLETIRKERKEAPKTDMSEADEPEMPTRRGIKCHLADSKRPKKEINEAEYPTQWVTQYGVDILYTEGQEDVEIRIEQALEKTGLKVLGCQPTDAEWSVEEYEKLVGYKIGESKEINEATDVDYIFSELDTMISKLKRNGLSVQELSNFKSKLSSVLSVKESCQESTSYRGLQNFKKQSESKAFYKTFKKMHDTLKEGKALTRQESIDLYKAANSALTQMSIELEHNPEFLKTFNESSTLLSADVNSLRESLARGKAPSKNTMKSLAKFSEALLCESPRGEEEAIRRWAEMDREGGRPVESYREFSKICLDEEGIDPTKELYNLYLEYYNSIDESKKVNEADDDESKMSRYGIMVNAPDKDGELKDKYRHILSIDAHSREEAIAIVKKKYPGMVIMNESEDEEDVEDEVAMDEVPADEETPEDDFVGDDEGDVQSEEADAFDQEYADARVALHKELAEKHADDPDVQDKLAQDAEEVTNLPGITDDQIAELNSEESPEEPEGDDIEDEPVEDEADEDDSEITDDELEELKKHLKEMRSAKKDSRLKESYNSKKFASMYSYLEKKAENSDRDAKWLEEIDNEMMKHLPGLSDNVARDFDNIKDEEVKNKLYNRLDSLVGGAFTPSRR